MWKLCPPHPEDLGASPCSLTLVSHSADQALRPFAGTLLGLIHAPLLMTPCRPLPSLPKVPPSSVPAGDPIFACSESSREPVLQVTMTGEHLHVTFYWDRKQQPTTVFSTEFLVV